MEWTRSSSVLWKWGEDSLGMRVLVQARGLDCGLDEHARGTSLHKLWRETCLRHITIPSGVSVNTENNNQSITNEPLCSNACMSQLRVWKWQNTVDADQGWEIAGYWLMTSRNIVLGVIATSLPKKGPFDQTKRQDKASSDPHDGLDIYRRHAHPFLTFQWI
jgi:hypothetical protein